MPQDEFYSFDEALDELRLKEEELKRLVSEGEIRAFRKGETMQLRKSDVESLRAELAGGEVVDLGEATEELVFEDDAELDDEAGMATQEIADVDTLIDDDVEDVGELELEDDPDPEPEVAASPARRRAPAPPPSMAAAAAEEEAEGGLMLAAMGAAFLVLVLAMPVALGVSSGTASGVAKTIAGLFGASFD